MRENREVRKLRVKEQRVELKYTTTIYNYRAVLSNCADYLGRVIFRYFSEHEK